MQYDNILNISVGIYDGPLDTKILEWMTARKQYNQIQLVSEQVNQPQLKLDLKGREILQFPVNLKISAILA